MRMHHLKQQPNYLITIHQALIVYIWCCISIESSSGVEEHIQEGYAFKNCGATGRHGPTQFECDSMYKATEVKVRVIQNHPLFGVQVWTVPNTTSYSITALGASGGTGVQNHDMSRGAYAHAVFNFTEGDEIYLLIGQHGSNACSQMNKKNLKANKICKHGFDESDKAVVGGGGGGGGGTFVFKRVPNSTELIPLIIAGGGGGKSYHQGGNPINAQGGLSTDPSGDGAITVLDGPGGGGGWFGGRMVYNQSGLSLLEGALGGKPCPQVIDIYNWETSGGFGGGGGGCTAGGGGGGYTGGNVSRTDNLEHNGQGGASYIHPEGDKARLEPGSNQFPHGEVEIAFVVKCPCEFMCIYKDYVNKEYKCYCSPNYVLAEDGHSCYDPRTGPKERRAEQLSTWAIVGIVCGSLFILLVFILIYCGYCMEQLSTLAIVGIVGGSLFILLVFILIYCGYCIVSQRHKSQQAGRLEQLSIPDYQLDRLRSTNTATTMMTEYNPHYDFGDSQYTVQDLKEIPRDNLSLVKALGQGAFGEVYQGYLTGASVDPPEIAVAVKTLPALSTDQAEMDFLMEALIMSKFHHPNIVRFIGVCFEKHPRYIIIELLGGGDLKTFLRESRPKPGYPSSVTMVSLVKLSLDIAKGCQYLEENHFIHRDIAARNCLLTTKALNRVAKIADFGMARDIYRADYYKKGGKAMLPVKWMPPEAFLDGIFTSKTDVWSFGILLWEVFSMGYMPYPGRGNQEVMQLVTAGGRLESPQNCPSPVNHIMNLCWHGIPERRPNFATIIEKLQQCLQDPDVIHSPLPVFHRPPSAERDTTVVHPPDPSKMAVLCVKKEPYIEPDTPNSLQPLIGPQSPDYDISMDVADAAAARQQQNHLNEGFRNRGHRGSLSDVPDNDDEGRLVDRGNKYGVNVFNYDSFGNTGSETQGLLTNQPPPRLSKNNNNEVDKHVEENIMNESLDDICSTHASHMNNSDSGRSSNSQFSSESISDTEASKFLKPDTQSSLTPQLDRSNNSNTQSNPSRNNRNSIQKDSRSLSNSPWLTRNGNNHTNEPRRPLYENMHLDSSWKGGHRSMSSLPHQVPTSTANTTATQAPSATHSNSLVNIPESRSDPGDSGVMIDFGKSARS